MYINRLNNVDANSYTPQETVGGCTTSQSREVRNAPFDQTSELSRVGDLRSGCVVFSAAWLDRIKNYNGEADSRMNYLRRVEVLQTVDTLQRSYRNREVNNRGSSFENLFQPTFQRFDLNLTNRGFMNVIGNEDGAMRNLANYLSEPGESHVLVLIRTNGDHHAIATHQEAGKLYIFDPNEGESTVNSRESTVKSTLRNIIQNYSYRVPVPEVHLLRAT
ncbi:YopT-type cysteine protease domain-containing protein [Brenneria izbisi]|uniref:YopT-type cysteine protease domain-containing protein n=1 Tax=Brenneria izbisi TaxID=2939450 RepID=A0AA41XV45_9GAMM|nr:YopT-type cysteine protease domain-containing protein [Brenneria izbisi]MCV9877408.1 YopT-type cysteine protease domain-containing protein [Brenneria izbisi]MCV9881026.1 YopT-type cysteine protease domain-containing protein [Brenneria izbisi]